MSVVIISKQVSEEEEDDVDIDDDELEINEDEEEEEDEELEDDVEDDEEDEELEDDVEDEEEEEDEEENVELEALELDDIDADNESLEIDAIDDTETGEFDLRDISTSETTYKRKHVKIQRYCKSTKELEPRFDAKVSPTPYLFEKIMGKVTSEHNAKQFTESCAKHDRDTLYQLCGKFMKKEYPFSELYKEIKSGKLDWWSTKTYAKEVDEELHELNIMTVKLSVSEGLYQCGRCKSKKTFSRQVQTRSADEGMTSIIQCSECNKVWREYA